MQNLPLPRNLSSIMIHVCKLRQKHSGSCFLTLFRQTPKYIHICLPVLSVLGSVESSACRSWALGPSLSLVRWIQPICYTGIHFAPEPPATYRLTPTSVEEPGGAGTTEEDDLKVDASSRKYMLPYRKICKCQVCLAGHIKKENLTSANLFYNMTLYH